MGLHRYTFPKGTPAHVLLDLRSSIYDYPGKVLWSRLRCDPTAPSPVSARPAAGRPGRQLYFAMRFSQPMRTMRSTTGKTTCRLQGLRTAGGGYAAGTRPGAKAAAWSACSTSACLRTALLVKIAVSPVSEDGADPQPG